MGVISHVLTILLPWSVFRAGLTPRRTYTKRGVAALQLEAWWTVDPYPLIRASDDVSTKHWNVDSLPQCPVYSAIKYSWAKTQRMFSVEQYRNQLPKQGE